MQGNAGEPSARATGRVAVAIAGAVMASIVGLFAWAAMDERERRDAERAEMEAFTQELEAHSDELEARLREAGVQVDPIEVEE